MPSLWTKDKEVEFFTEALKSSSAEQLFYVGDDDRYYAYWPKTYSGKTSTLQSRNAFIGNFTEQYSVDLLGEFATSKGLFAVQGVVCDEIGLTQLSPADVAICTSTDRFQTAENIRALFEVKMSIVWNWEFINGEIRCLGDYETHKGNPGLLRSDSMLKAIGKSINIRVSGHQASKIPIIILGNTPITDSYKSKVDHLKQAGIIQGFWSVNSNPLDYSDSIKNTNEGGFMRMDTYSELNNHLDNLFSNQLEFFSSMIGKSELGRIIETASQGSSYDQKAEIFLSLIRE